MQFFNDLQLCATYCHKGLGIPGYWAKVLRAAPLIRNYLTEMDLEILQYLEGIRYSFSKKLSSPVNCHISYFWYQNLGQEEETNDVVKTFILPRAGELSQLCLLN